MKNTSACRFNHQLTIRRSRGQGLIEALIGTSVLIALMLLIVILGKYQSVDLAAIHAARNLAFDCAVLPRDCVTAKPDPSLRNRVVSRLTGSGPEQPSIHPAIWTTRNGRPLLERPDDIDIELAHPHFGAGLGVAGQGPASRARSAVELVSKFAGPGKFGLGITDGLTRAHVSMNLLASRGQASPALILDGMPLRPRSGLAVLTDAWNASGPRGDAEAVHERVGQGWHVDRALETAVSIPYAVTRAAIWFMHALKLEKHSSAFRQHRVDVDIVPPDRLPSDGAAAR